MRAAVFLLELPTAFFPSLPAEGGTELKRALAEADSAHIPWCEPFTLAERNGATHRVWETTSTYEGRPVRLIVVESSALDQRKGKTLEKERAKEAELLREEQARWERHPFSYRKDAEQALASLKASLRPRFHRVEAAVEKIVRPKKGAEPDMETLHLLRLDVEFDQDAWKQAKRKASQFVLVTDRSEGMEGPTNGCPRNLEAV